MDMIQISTDKDITIEIKDTMANIPIMVTGHINGNNRCHNKLQIHKSPRDR